LFCSFRCIIHFFVNQIIHETLSIATNNSPTLHEARASWMDLTRSLFSSNSFISPIVIYFYYVSLLCIYKISNFLRYRKDYLFFVLLRQISIVECDQNMYHIFDEHGPFFNKFSFHDHVTCFAICYSCYLPFYKN